MMRNNSKEILVFSISMCYNRTMTVIMYFFGKISEADRWQK